jgi:5S rRNA maturation endonuclease (ribonuclease M5)
MGNSNGEWGELAPEDDLAEVWDACITLPEPGENVALDAFVEAKHISIQSLVRLGARLAEPNLLAFAFPGGIKFRDLITNRRWAYAGSEWRAMKVVRHSASPTDYVIVAEGETDAARLSDAYPCDVAVMPAGALTFKPEYAKQLSGYRAVFVGLDDDAAGNRGSDAILKALPNAIRFTPPANDWCSSEEMPELPDASTLAFVHVLVPAGELLDLEPPPVVSWFEGALLPVGGQLIIHGWAKSFKSFIGIDMLAALSQGLDWCCFEPTEEACRVVAMQYEIPWAYYQQRVRMMRAHAREPELFDRNFLSWTPMQRPSFRAGDTGQEDFVLKQLTDHDVQVFFLDPIRRATGAVDLNSEEAVRPLLDFFARLQDNGITVVTTHHDNKTYARQGGGDPLGMTGTGAFAGDADTVVSVSLPRGSSIEDPRRNLHFLLRNAPSVSPRGMAIDGEGGLTYSTTPWGDGLAGDDSGPPI